MISCLRLTSSHPCRRLLDCLPKLGDTLPNKRMKKYACIYSINGNYRETARVFYINKSTVRGMIDARPLPEKIKVLEQMRFFRCCQTTKLSHWTIWWTAEMNFCFKGFAFSVMSLQEKAKLVIQPHNSSFNKSRGWVRKFFNRHKLVLRTRTSISQKLPKQLEGVFSIFYEDAARFMRIEKYPLSPAGNMDQTPAFFCHGPIKVFWKEVRGRMWFVLQGLKKTRNIIVITPSPPYKETCW